MLSTYFYQIQLDTDAPFEILEKYKNYSNMFKHNKVISVLSLKNRFEKDKDILRTVLASYGYFNSTVQYIISKGDKDLLILNIFLKLNQRFSVKKIYFSGLSEEEEKKIRQLIKSKEDSFLNENHLTESLTIIEHYFKNKGHPFVIVFKPKVEINFAEKNMNIYIHINKEEKKFFGPENILNLKHLKEDFIKANILWKQGDLYQKNLVEQTKKKLVDSGLISYISIKSEFNEKKDLPMRMKVYEAPRRIFISEAGYSKELGTEDYGELSGSLSWRHKNLFGHGENIQFSGNLRQRLQKEYPYFKNLQMKIKIPHAFRYPSLSFITDLSYTVEEISAYTGNIGIISAGFEKDITDHLALEARVLFDIGDIKKSVETWNNGISNFDQPELSEFKAKFLSFPITLRWDETNDFFDPTRGFKLDFTVEPSGFVDGSAQSAASLDKLFVLMKLSFAHAVRLYKRGEKRVVFYNQVSIGNILGATTRESIIPHKRLYLGGVRTFRAYGEKRVGDIDDMGKPYGGISFFMWMPELRFKFQDTWGINLHYGLGFVSQNHLWNRANKELFHGFGISAVYYSRIGPIQGGVAFPLGRRRDFHNVYKEERKDSFLQIYVGIGQI